MLCRRQGRTTIVTLAARYTGSQTSEALIQGLSISEAYDDESQKKPSTGNCPTVGRRAVCLGSHADGNVGLSITGTLNFSALGAGGFKIDLVSLQFPGGSPGDADNFSAEPESSYVWEFVRADSFVGVFDESLFDLDTSGFSNSVTNTFGAGQFAIIELSGNALAITFNSAVPEPSTLILSALGLLGLGLVGRRRKR